MKKINFKKTIKFINFLTKKKYTYNFNWLGVKTIQFPSDLIVIQELIFKNKPDIIIETGVAHGGTLIFYSSILELIGKKYKKVIGIDVLIKDHNKEKIKNHKLSKNIKLIECSSTDKSILKKLNLKKNKKILVVLDSNHSEEHVLKELEIYSKIVSKNSYIIVLDTVIEYLDEKLNKKNKPFSRGNNPFTAVKKFLKFNRNFKIDRKYENLAVISNGYSGFLKKIK